MATTRKSHTDSRLPQVLDEAARLFRTQGFGGTSVRDIARAVGMLPGSLYCHFATKEALLTAVYVKGVEQISAAVNTAVARHTDPWQRLEAACVAHLESILRDDDYAQVVIRVHPADIPAASPTLIDLRNRYEALFIELIKALPLRVGTDRRSFRLLLIGGLNSSQIWYRPNGRYKPRAIAHNFIALLRQGQEVAT
jgi:TetR/AcrR family transcriptional regulator, cholesterol catabolism regulator